MATRFYLEPSPGEPNLLATAWKQWFELLRNAVSAISTQVDSLFTLISTLDGRVTAIETTGVDKLTVTYKAGFPTAAELRTFSMSVWKNTATNEWRLWFLESGQRYAFVLTPMDGPL